VVFAGIQLHLDIPVHIVRELVRQGESAHQRRGEERGRDFTDLGHGSQRSLQMAPIRYIWEVRGGEAQTA
jgi:putative ATP-dependent endonuclease of OLD family